MDADTFRGDRYLRASAYHLLGWAIVGLGATLPLYSAVFGHSWPQPWPWLFRLALGGSGLIWSFVCERRALKICGAPSAPARAGLARLVMVVLAVAALATALAVAWAAPQYIAAVWLLAVAVLLAALGWWVPPYRVSAAVVATGGALVFALALLERGSQVALGIACVWNGLLVTVVMPCALLVNRRYLWRFDNN